MRSEGLPCTNSCTLTEGGQWTLQAAANGEAHLPAVDGGVTGPAVAGEAEIPAIDAVPDEAVEAAAGLTREETEQGAKR